MGLFAKAASLRDRAPAPGSPPDEARPPAAVPTAALADAPAVVPEEDEPPEATLEAEPVEQAEPAIQATLAEELPPSAFDEEIPGEAPGEPEPIVEWDEPEDAEEAAPPTAPGGAMETRLAGAVTDIMNIQAGIEAPGLVFALLQRHLGIERAAILVPDPARGAYSPWAASGLDKTSLRKLRVPVDEAASLTISCMKGASLARFQKLYSSRDSASLERLYVWPCPGTRGPSALVLAADMDPSLAGEAGVVDYLPAILQAAGQTLSERRENELDRLRSRALRPVAAPPQEVVADALSRAPQAGARVRLVRVALGRIVEAVLAVAPAVDRFRLAEDVATVWSALAQDTADVAIANTPDALFLVVHGATQPDPELLVHAILGALRAVLPSAAALGPADLELRSAGYPEDGRTPAELIAAAG
jgi:hypothetical protein